MNQNNRENYLFFFCILLFSLAFGWLEFPEFLASPSGDPVGTALLISQPLPTWANTSDWHELLLVYEGRCFYQTLKLFCSGIDYTYGNQVLHIMWCMNTVMLYFMLCLLIYSLRQQRNTLLGFLFFFCISVIFIRHYNYSLFHKYLDGFFYPFIISALVSVRLYRLSSGKMRFFWFLFAIFCLFHCVGYRRVSILTLPFFFYALAPVFLRRKVLFYRLATAISAACCFGFCFQLIFRLLPSTHEHPAIVMMYSDMSIASLLAGDKASFQSTCNELGVEGLVIENRNHTPDSLHQSCFVTQHKPDTQERWNHFLQVYVDYTQKHPKEMILGKVVSIIQFYSNCHVPVFARNAIISLCPNAKLSENAWDIKPSTRHDTGGSYEKIYLYTLSGCLLIFLFFKRRHLDDETRFFMFVSLVGFVYSLSYCIVTPTPDARYHAFSVMAQCLFLSYVAARACVHLHHKLSNRLQNSEQRQISPETDK